jgi:hypothetical protein
MRAHSERYADGEILCDCGPDTTLKAWEGLGSAAEGKAERAEHEEGPNEERDDLDWILNCMEEASAVKKNKVA